MNAIEKGNLLNRLGKDLDANIAREFGLSRERIRQIRNHYKIAKYRRGIGFYNPNRICPKCKEVKRKESKQCLKCSRHHMWGTKTYWAWHNMKQRCHNPKHSAYKWYGNRGIKVCNRCMEFENFFTDMGRKPEGLTLERINNNGNYELENCKWVTRNEQNLNKRINKNTRRKIGIASHLLHSNGWSKTKVRLIFGISYHIFNKYCS